MAKTQVDLASFIGKDGTFALNVDSRFPMENLDKSDDRFEVRSDADDQLIMHFAFTEKVKVSGFCLKAPTNEFMPTGIKLFVNLVSVDFGDVEDAPAAFEADLGKDDVAGDKVVPLRVVKFNGIDTLTVFISGSEGGEVAALSSLKFFGETLQGTNMTELKKVG